MTSKFLATTSFILTLATLSGCTLLGAGIASKNPAKTTTLVGFEERLADLDQVEAHPLVQFRFKQGAVVEGRWLPDNGFIQVPTDSRTTNPYVPASLDSLEAAYLPVYETEEESRVATGVVIGLVLDLAALYVIASGLAIASAWGG